MAADEIIRTTEMHTGGEPVRIVESGYPTIRGTTILDKRRYVSQELDHLRRRLMFEPRGHFDMYGVILVEPDLPEADLAVVFMHNEGYSTMCGHATIALGRYAVDRGLVERVEPITELVIQCPCGPVRVEVDVAGGKAGAVRFESVGAFAEILDHEVDVPGYGSIRCDVAYGGAFYAIADASQFSLLVAPNALSELTSAATALTAAVNRSMTLTHPDSDDLGFLYGSILTDGLEDGPSANVCVFADRQVDRSPTGSGVTARMALRHVRGRAGIGETHRFASLTGSEMTGEVVSLSTVGDHDAVTVVVGGQAFYTGQSEFVTEPTDPLRDGFLLR